MDDASPYSELLNSRFSSTESCAVVPGPRSHHAKSTRAGLDLITIRRTLPHGNGVARDQLVKRSVFPFARGVQPLRRGDPDQVTLYPGNVDGSLRVARARHRR